MQLEIAAFEESDRAALRKLYREVRQTNFTWLDAATARQFSFDQDTEGEFILVARKAGKIAGFAGAWLPDNFIHHLYVHNDFHGQGIGTELLQEMIDHLMPSLP